MIKTWALGQNLLLKMFLIAPYLQPCHLTMNSTFVTPIIQGNKAWGEQGIIWRHCNISSCGWCVEKNWQMCYSCSNAVMVCKIETHMIKYANFCFFCKHFWPPNLWTFKHFRDSAGPKIAVTNASNCDIYTTLPYNHDLCFSCSNPGLSGLRRTRQELEGLAHLQMWSFVEKKLQCLTLELIM